MTNLPWIKLYIEIIDDPKLHRLTDAQKWRFVQLLALAGENDAEGYLSSSGKPLNPEDIAWRLRSDLAKLQDDLHALAQAELVVLDEAQEAWLIPSFAKRQERPDDEKRRYWREKKRRQRAKRTSVLDEAEWADFENRPPAPDADDMEAEDGSDELFSPDEADAGQDLSADKSVESILDRYENVPLKRRIEQESRGHKSRE